MNRPLLATSVKGFKWTNQSTVRMIPSSLVSPVAALYHHIVWPGVNRGLPVTRLSDGYLYFIVMSAIHTRER